MHRKKLLNITKWDKKVADKIDRVKYLRASEKSPWITNRRQSKSKGGRIWDNNKLIRVPKVGEVMVKKFGEHGFNKV